MPQFRKRLMVIDALQWTGSNQSEVKAWMRSIMHRDVQPIPDIALFVRRRSKDMTKTLFENVLESPSNDVTAALWVAANGAYLGIVDGEWIAHDSLGFYPISDGGEGAPMNYDAVEVEA